MRFCLMKVALCAAVAVTCAVMTSAAATRVSAAEAEDAAHAMGSEGDAHAGPSGPMTATKQDADLAIWSLITFCVLLFVLRKYAWGPMIDGLNKREAGVLDNIAAAEAAHIKATKMLAEHAAKLERVQDEVREILAEARRDADHTRHEIIAAAQKEAETTRQRAVQDIERARDEALNGLFGHMARCVNEATEHVIGRALTGADNERLIEESLSGFAQRAH